MPLSHEGSPLYWLLPHTTYHLPTPNGWRQKHPCFPKGGTPWTTDTHPHTCMRTHTCTHTHRHTRTDTQTRRESSALCRLCRCLVYVCFAHESLHCPFRPHLSAPGVVQDWVWGRSGSRPEARAQSGGRQKANRHAPGHAWAWRCPAQKECQRCTRGHSKTAVRVGNTTGSVNASRRRSGKGSTNSRKGSALQLQYHACHQSRKSSSWVATLMWTSSRLHLNLTGGQSAASMAFSRVQSRNQR